MTAAREILDLAWSRSPTLGATRVVAVDGPSGSGKTTLARAVLAAASPGSTAAVVHLDDVYAGWRGLATLGTDLCRLLAPLATGEPATWRSWDWPADSPGAPRSQAPVDLLVVDGVGAGHHEVASLVTVLVWVEGDPADNGERALARDVAAHPSAAADPAAYRRRLEEWQRDEAAYFLVDAPKERADIVLG